MWIRSPCHALLLDEQRAQRMIFALGDSCLARCTILPQPLCRGSSDRLADFFGSRPFPFHGAAHGVEAQHRPKPCNRPKKQRPREQLCRSVGSRQNFLKLDASKNLANSRPFRLPPSHM